MPTTSSAANTPMKTTDEPEGCCRPEISTGKLFPEPGSFMVLSWRSTCCGHCRWMAAHPFLPRAGNPLPEIAAAGVQNPQGTVSKGLILLYHIPQSPIFLLWPDALC